MRRFVLTGAPGAGKTAILRQLELEGFSVVEEAATDVIAAAQAEGRDEPWMEAGFLDAVAELQRARLVRTSCQAEEVQFHDRCVVCTAALAAYLERPIPPGLERELERIVRDGVFERRVFFVRNLGFVTPTAARRIRFEETVRFEKIHEEVYRRFGFELVYVEAGSVAARVAAVRAAVG